MTQAYHTGAPRAVTDPGPGIAPTDTPYQPPTPGLPSTPPVEPIEDPPLPPAGDPPVSDPVPIPSPVTV